MMMMMMMMMLAHTWVACEHAWCACMCCFLCYCPETPCPVGTPRPVHVPGAWIAATHTSCKPLFNGTGGCMAAGRLSLCTWWSHTWQRRLVCCPRTNTMYVCARSSRHRYVPPSISNQVHLYDFVGGCCKWMLRAETLSADMHAMFHFGFAVSYHFKPTIRSPEHVFTNMGCYGESKHS
jgi:hypothetical protein